MTRHSNSSRLPAAFSLILLPLTAILALSGCQTNAVKPATSDNGAAGASAAAKPEPIIVSSPIGRVAAEKGIRTCLQPIDKTAAFLSQSGPNGIYISSSLNSEPGKPTPDEKLFLTSMEISSSAGTTYASTVAAPMADGSCSTLYETVTWLPLSCTDLETQYYGNLKRKGVIREKITNLAGAGNLHIFLMAAGSGCITIKQEAPL